MKLFSQLFSLALLIGCSSTDPHPTITTLEANSSRSIELYLSRASVSKSEFEQFKVTNEHIYVECGKIAGGRQSAQYQELSPLSQVDQNEIHDLTSTIVDFSNSHTLHLDQAGNSDIFYDPGQFILKLEGPSNKILIKTSLDSIASASKTSEDNLKKLAIKLRESAKKASNSGNLCGNNKFFDLD